MKRMGKPDQPITLHEVLDNANNRWSGTADRGRTINTMALVKSGKRPTEGESGGQITAQQFQVFWVRSRNPLFADFKPQDWQLEWRGRQWVIVGVIQNSGRWYRGRWLGLEARIAT